MAEVTFATFCLQRNLSGGKQLGCAVIQTPRLMQAHNDLTINDVYAVAVKGDQINPVPFALGIFGVLAVGAMIADWSFLQEERVGAVRGVAP